MKTLPLKSASALSTLATLMLGGAFLAAPGTASADYKTGSGGMCQPYGKTTPDDLRYLVNGVTTRYDYDATILCNLAPDVEYSWYSATTSADARLYFKAGNADAPVTCTATVGSSYMYGSLSYSQAMTIPATLTYTMNINDMRAPGAYSWAPAAITCVLPKRAVLARIVLYERGAT